jgi:hypothetical protein
MRITDVIGYYSREDIQSTLISMAKGREVAGVYKGGEYSKRPGTLFYPRDITAMVRSGILEFHSSLERWSNPMSIKPENYDEIRTGWDIVLDLDCELLEHGIIAAAVLCKALERHDIKNYSVKFTGGTGFHVGIPWETIPDKIDYKPSRRMFPDLARKIGLYIRGFMRADLEKALLKTYSVEELARQVDRPLNNILVGESVDPYRIVDIDPILISPRHLFRMPYSLNKKNWLVSLPIRAKNIEDFGREDARPGKVKPRLGFLDSGEENESEMLVAEALDWWTKNQAKERKRRVIRKIEYDKPIPEEHFPPCIKLILNGLSDGRKRSVFILVTFLRSVGWSWTDIDSKLSEWNRRNNPPLGDNYIRTQFRWHRQQGKKILPPNCNAEGWYKSFLSESQENLCGGLKNPVNYAFRKVLGGQKSKKPFKN